MSFTGRQMAVHGPPTHLPTLTNSRRAAGSKIGINLEMGKSDTDGKVDNVEGLERVSISAIRLFFGSQ